MLTILNLHRAYKINERLVKRIVTYILRRVFPGGKTELGFIFLTDRKIRTLNKKYKGEDRATDVLSFDLSVREAHSSVPLSGEIYISVDKARKNSKIFNTRFKEEFVLYVIHGILHLVGYDDESPKDRVRMEKKQEEMLKILCRKENLSKVLTRR
ncbi:MAG: rRNA maturation RNase YbeY [Candidatus Omnitrophota bacterium]